MTVADSHCCDDAEVGCGTRKCRQMELKLEFLKINSKSLEEIFLYPIDENKNF